MTLKSMITRRPSARQKLVAGAIAGLASSAAYAFVQAWDLKMFDYPTDDFVLLGSMAPVDDDLARPLGVVMHLGNGAALGAAYTLIGHERLPGSPLVRGLTWTMGETFALYPLALLEHLHPAVRDGRLPSYLTGTAFIQQLLRHVAYGIVLGPMTERLLSRK
jgi:hypothetical protein